MNQLTETELFEEPALRVATGTTEELAKVEPPEVRAALVLKSTQTEIDLRALAVKNVSIVQVIDKAGREQAHGAAMEIKHARVAIEKTGKDARDDATKFSKAVIAEEKRLIAIIEHEEARLIGLRNAWDDEQARIKAEEKAKEKARIAAIRGRIEQIRTYSITAIKCRTASNVDDLLVDLRNFDMSGFDEFIEEANNVHTETVSAVEFVYKERLDGEAELARIKAQQDAARAALKQAQEEQAAAATALKQAQDKARAKQAAAAAKLAEERAELEAAKSAALQTIEDAKPKAEPEPLAEQESNLHQTGFVWRTPEITEKPIDPEPEDIKPVTRPTDLEIIYALSGYFIAPRTTVIKWLREMDFDALERGAT